jgi:transcriptional regulator with XRE-family HTH domain
MRGLSQEAWAGLAGVSRPWLSQLESNKKSPRVDDLEKLLRPLGFTVERFFAEGSLSPSTGPATSAHDQANVTAHPSVILPAGRTGYAGYLQEEGDVSRGSALHLLALDGIALAAAASTIDLERLVAAAANPQIVDAGLIDGLRTITRSLASQRQVVASDALLVPMLAHRDNLYRLFVGVGSELQRRNLGCVLAETSIVASRLFSAAGDRSQALASCAFARALAIKLDDPVLGSTALLFESNLHSDAATLIDSRGDIMLGLRLLTQAAAVDRSLSPAARARIAAEQAQAFAVVGLREECTAALRRAEDAANQIGDGDRVGLFSDWTAARLPVYAGTCWLFLAEAKKAVMALEEASQDAKASQPNVALAAQVDLASAYAESGELEEGCRILGETFAELIDMGNERGLRRARRARERLVRWENEPPVRDLDERIGSFALQ